MSSKKHKRYKLLLDEGLHLPNCYPKLNSYHNIVHIVETRNKGQSDVAVFNIAEKEERLSVVFNTKNFKPLISGDSGSVISLSTNLTDEQADLKMCKVLRELKPSQTRGHLIEITNSGIKITKM